ncbi:hypothetical protein BH24PSE2_BH24PSE2_04940 [soil metagenome]
MPPPASPCAKRSAVAAIGHMSPDPNVFAGFIERMAYRRRNAAWIDEAYASPRARFVGVFRSLNLVSDDDPPRPVLLTKDEVAELAVGPPVYLGRFGPHECFACAFSDDAARQSVGREFHDLHRVGALLEHADAALLAYARAMLLWHENHRHCGRCGASLSAADAGHLLVCENARCGAQQFPRLDPAIIALVADEEQCLLGRQAGWPPGRYSAIAGFVEPGESCESAVAREVLEETGVAVTDVRYHSSQPWPFPASLMLGFSARPASKTIELRDEELEDARWFTRSEIAAGAAGRPSRVSISARLIEDWLRASRS